MENFENEMNWEEAMEPVPEEAQPEPQPQQYNGAGVGRRESPFADSPYVMDHRPAGHYYDPDRSHAPRHQAPVKKKKAKSKVWSRVLAAVLAVALVAGGCGLTAALMNDHWEDQMDQVTQQYDQKLRQLQEEIATMQVTASGNSVSGSPVSSGDGLTPSQVYAQNARSVVLITCSIQSSMYGQVTTGSSTGSGFIISGDGYVVTNNHVVEGATSVTVTTFDGTELKAAVVGTDSTNDVAVLKAETETELPAVVIGASSDLIVGDQVVAIGNPLGELTSTMTVGYVSAMDRDVTTDGRTITMIQTDAAINSGNSGGPLFNMKGEVIGITTAKYSGSSSSGATIESIGFAIPIDDVIGMVDDLVNYGYVTGAYLGVMVSDMDADVAAYTGLPLGARIEEVTAGYCAEAAGLQARDIIVDVGGYEVTNVSTLSRALRHFEAGDTTTITVFRSGAEMTFTITLDEKPQDTTTSADTQQPSADEMPQDGSFEDYRDFFEKFFGGMG